MPWFKKVSYAGKSVLITGGSTGIGFALAAELVQRGAHVTLVARTQSRLDSAIEDLRSMAEGGPVPVRVQGFAADVCDSRQVKDALKFAGAIDVLICCAGAAFPGYFVKQDMGDFETTMQLNYFGTLRVIKAALPDMMERRQGEIVLVSSAAAVVGVAGYTSYAPTKAAVRSLADTLRNELLSSGVRVMVAYPPDTDTPGYANENLSKPQVCHDISRAAGDVLFTPEQVAKCMIKGMERGAYHLPSPDFGQNLMIAASAGLSPHMFPAVLEVLLAPLVVLALWIFGYRIDNAVRNHADV